MDDETRKRVQERADALLRLNPNSDAQKNWQQAIKEQDEAQLAEALAASARDHERSNDTLEEESVEMQRTLLQSAQNAQVHVTQHQLPDSTPENNDGSSVVGMTTDIKRMSVDGNSDTSKDDDGNKSNHDMSDSDEDTSVRNNSSDDGSTLPSAVSPTTTTTSASPSFSSDSDNNETIKAEDGRYVQFKNWDMWKIKRCLVHHDFETLTKVGGVIPVNGITNAGKSVTITCQHPSVSRVPSGIRKEYVCISSTPNVRAPRSRLRTDKQSWMSMSGNLTLYNQGGVWYADMPGLQDTRGKEEVLWTHACLNLFYSTVQSIPAVLVVINFASHFYHDRGSTEQFNQLAVKLHECFGGQKDIAKSVVFVLTRPFDQEGEFITYDDISERAREYIQGQTEAIRMKEKDLRMRFKQRSKQFQSHDELMLMTEYSDDFCSDVDIDPDEVSRQDEEDWTYIKERRAGIYVMEMVQAALEDYRVCISNPVDHTTTEVQRLLINEMILRARPVSSTALEAIRTTAVANSLEFCKILAELARDYNQILRKLVKDLEALADLAKLHSSGSEKLLDYIQSDWEKVRDEKLATTNALIAKMDHSKSCMENDSKKYICSEHQVVADSKLISRSKESGLFSWTMFGGGWAEEKYEFTEGIPFVTFKLTGGTSEHISITNRTENKHAGKLKFKLVSKKGYDLRTIVQVYALEKNLLSSKERVKKNEGAIYQLVDELDRARNFKISLENCQSAKELTRLLCEDFDALEAAVQNETNELKKNVSSLVGNRPEQIVQEEHVRVKLYKLLKLLTGRQLLHPSLSQADLADITEFCDFNNTYHKLLSDPFLQRHSPNHQVIVGELSNPDESNARVEIIDPNSMSDSSGLNSTATSRSYWSPVSQMPIPTTPPPTVSNNIPSQPSIEPPSHPAAMNMNHEVIHSNRVTFKVYSLDSDETRRFTIENNFEVFKQRLQSLLSQPLSEYRLTWTDCDGDHIAVTTNNDFNEAIAYQQELQASDIVRQQIHVFYTKQHAATPLSMDSNNTKIPRSKCYEKSSLGGESQRCNASPARHPTLTSHAKETTTTTTTI